VGKNKKNGKNFDFCHFLWYNNNGWQNKVNYDWKSKYKDLEGVTYMYNVGDKVVYPMHGAGVIDAIEEKEILGEKQSYYILKMPGEVKVMVPTLTAEEHGIRNVIDKAEAEKVINVLEQDETEMEKNWNKRYRDNMDKMKSGNIYEIADVVRNLSFKQKEKGLSTGEKKMLYNAKQILVSELVLAEHATQDEVEELVDNKINTSFAMFKTDADVSIDTGNIVNKFIPFNDETGSSHNVWKNRIKKEL